MQASPSVWLYLAFGAAFMARFSFLESCEGGGVLEPQVSVNCEKKTMISVYHTLKVCHVDEGSFFNLSLR